MPHAEGHLWFGLSVSQPIVTSRQHLETRDLDTPPSGLMYIINTPTNGYVALKDNPRQNIVNFTQQLINTEQVVFVNTGTQGKA